LNALIPHRLEMLELGAPDVFDLIENADRFWYGDRWYSREGFLLLLERAESADAE